MAVWLELLVDDSLGELVWVGLDVPVKVDDGVADGLGVADAEIDWLGVRVCVGLWDCVGVTVCVGLWDCVGVAVGVELRDCVAVWLGVGVMGASATPR